jgi:hypothetical protein
MSRDLDDRRGGENTRGCVVNRPVLLKRLPKLWWQRRDPEPLIAPEERAQYPELEADFALLDELLLPTFHQRDTAALEAQNAFWRQQLLLIVGGTAATVLGIVQSALGGGVVVLGLTEAVVASLLTWLALSARAGSWHRRYLTSRLQAERLRSEYFVFLAHAGSYRGTKGDARISPLRATIDELETDEPE